MLQIHDFAEDFRPVQYNHLAQELAGGDGSGLSDLLYPQASQVHYATLNGRDHSALQRAGVDPARLHLLPNPVHEPDLPQRAACRDQLRSRFGIPLDANFILYPVRGIGRKNLAEALLWSAVADRGSFFGLTLAPINPVERAGYDRWKNLAGELGLNWHFEMGEADGLPFPEVLSAADLLLTTSVAEGFGMTYLESCLAGKPLAGRDLPEITADFSRAGLQFPWLKSEFRIPLDWLDENRLLAAIAGGYQRVRSAYGLPPSDRDALNRNFRNRIASGHFDFACCPTTFQQDILRRVADDTQAGQQLVKMNPILQLARQPSGYPDSVMERNASRVRSEYSMQRVGEQLLNIYRSLANSETDPQLRPPGHGSGILESFLPFECFYPVRIDP